MSAARLYDYDASDAGPRPRSELASTQPSTATVKLLRAPRGRTELFAQAYREDQMVSSSKSLTNDRTAQ